MKGMIRKACRSFHLSTCGATKGKKLQGYESDMLPIRDGLCGVSILPRLAPKWNTAMLHTEKKCTQPGPTGQEQPWKTAKVA